MASNVRGTSLRRVLRSTGGRVIRRLGLLPGGTPDGLGDDDRLSGTVVKQRAVVYFADTIDGMYQIRQWYGPLRELDACVGVLVIACDSRTAQAVRMESGLKVVTIARYATLDELLARSEVRLALYVNHNPLNFSMLRFTSVAHVSLLHGDSDKVVSVSNQAKAYDLSFVAGQAAVDRLARYIPYFGAKERCVLVGRPQFDTGDSPRLGATSNGGPPTVLYAPTWEGAQPSAAYGSVDELGEELVRRVIADGRLRLIYRPHPLSGVRSPAYGDADAEVRRLVARAAERDPSVGHRISNDEDISSAFADADLLVCDVSAVAMDWLPSLRPLVVTDIPREGVMTAATPLLSTVTRLGRSDLTDVTTMLRSEMEQDTGRPERERLVSYYMGDTSPGAALERFLDACVQTIELHEAELSRLES